MSTYEDLRLSTVEQQALFHLPRANGNFSPQSTQNSTSMSSVQDELDFRPTSHSPSSQTTASSNSGDANTDKNRFRYASSQLSKALDISSLGFYSGPSLNNSMISSKRHAQFVRRSIVISPSLNSIHSLTASSSYNSNLSSQTTEASETPTATINMVNSPSIRALSDILNNDVEKKARKFDVITEEEEQLDSPNNFSSSQHTTPSSSFTGNTPHTPSPKSRRPICFSHSSTNLSPQKVEAIKANTISYLDSGPAENQPDLISLTSTPKASSCSTLCSPIYSPPSTFTKGNIFRSSPAHSPVMHSPVDHKVGTPIQFGISDDSSIEHDSKDRGSPRSEHKNSLSPALSVCNSNQNKLSDSSYVREGDLMTPKLFSPDLVFDEPVEKLNVLKNESSTSEPLQVKEIGYTPEKDSPTLGEDLNSSKAYEKIFRLHFSSYDGEPLDRKIDVLEKLHSEDQRSAFVKKTEKHRSMDDEQNRLSIRMIPDDSEVDGDNSQIPAAHTEEKAKSVSEKHIDLTSLKQKNRVEDIAENSAEAEEQIASEPEIEMAEIPEITNEQNEEETPSQKKEPEVVKPLPSLPINTTDITKEKNKHSPQAPVKTSMKKDLRFKSLFSGNKSNAKGIDSTDLKPHENVKNNVENNTATSKTKTKRQRRSMFSDWGRRSFSFVHGHGSNSKKKERKHKNHSTKHMSLMARTSNKKSREQKDKKQVVTKVEPLEKLCRKISDDQKHVEVNEDKKIKEQRKREVAKEVKETNDTKYLQYTPEKSDVFSKKKKTSEVDKTPAIAEMQTSTPPQSTKAISRTAETMNFDKIQITEVETSPASQQLSFTSSVRSSSKMRFGDSLFPKSLSNSEVESIVSLERSRSKASLCSHSISPVITPSYRLTPTPSVDSIVKMIQESDSSVKETTSKDVIATDEKIDPPKSLDLVNAQLVEQPANGAISPVLSEETLKESFHPKKKKPAGLGISRHKKLHADSDISEIMNSVSFSDDDESFDTNFYLTDAGTGNSGDVSAGSRSGHIHKSHKFTSLPEPENFQRESTGNVNKTKDSPMDRHSFTEKLKDTSLFEGLSPSLRGSLKSETKTAILGSLAGTSDSYDIEDQFPADEIYGEFENEDGDNYGDFEYDLETREPEVDFFKTGVSLATSDNGGIMVENDYTENTQKSPKRLSLISKISSSKSSLKSKSPKFTSPPLSMHSFAKSPSASMHTFSPCAIKKNTKVHSVLSKKRLENRGPKQSKRKPRHIGVKFSSEVVLYSTYGDDEYDRHPGNAACNNLTPELAMDIRNELNMFKAEMVVNEHSRCYTHFL